MNDTAEKEGRKPGLQEVIPGNNAVCRWTIYCDGLEGASISEDDLHTMINQPGRPRPGYCHAQAERSRLTGFADWNPCILQIRDHQQAQGTVISSYLFDRETGVQRKTPEERLAVTVSAAREDVSLLPGLLPGRSAIGGIPEPRSEKDLLARILILQPWPRMQMVTLLH